MVRHRRLSQSDVVILRAYDEASGDPHLYAPGRRRRHAVEAAARRCGVDEATVERALSQRGIQAGELDRAVARLRALAVISVNARTNKCEL